MADVSETNASDELSDSAYDNEIDIIENVHIYDACDRNHPVVLDITHGTLFFKDGKLVNHITRKSHTEINLGNATYERSKGY
jgi:hypothetical protein